MTEYAGGRRREYRGWWPSWGLRKARPQDERSEDPDDGNGTDPREGLHTKFRGFLRFGLMRARAPLRTGIRSGEPPSVRAVLKSARIQERYFYHQRVSLNDSIEPCEHPMGEIKLVLPYDGDKCFTRQAYQDVERARHHGADRDDALVGFLTLSGYEKTDLDSILNLDLKHGSYPIEMRLPSAPGNENEEPLLADDSSCAITIDYEPREESGKAFPVHLDIEVLDPDTADILWPLWNIDTGLDRNIMRQVEFLPGLSLRVRVRLNLPRKLAANAHARVKEVFVGWPTHTSLSSLKLQAVQETRPFWYNPERVGGGGLEWHDVSVKPVRSEGGDVQLFRSEWMTLSISKPGDLYHQATLCGQVDVTVNRLLSGTDARLFDATGKLCRRPVCELESLISTTFTLTLDDAFARRVQSPQQQMHFDEVILTAARVDDISTALRNRGFAVRPDGPFAQSSADATGWWLRAERVQGAEKLSMLIFVYGKRYRTRRQRQIDGGIEYQTTIESGDLQLYIYGFLRGDSETVVQEMNALRRALRERFDRLPARR